MIRHIKGDYVIIISKEKSRTPALAVYRNNKQIVEYSDRYGFDVFQGTCEEIVDAIKLAKEYFPHKVVSLF